MSRAVQELKQIPFGYLIGEPLKAAVEAQAVAAKTTIEFIEKVGFVPASAAEDMLFVDEAKDADAGTVRNVTFKYRKKDENNQDVEHSLSVPILSIVPIPVLRIDEVTIDFTAKINDTIENTTKNNFQLTADVGGKYKSWWSPISLEFRTSLKYETASQTSARYTRDYTMSIHVRAVQDDIPAGLSRVLDILESSIKESKVEP
ncbi:MAG TPA: DUF2589 domain-containing protein [Blastocatellia bacterium]|nr:DUF2589 domain-containing protein [Blastocatellia bacterium]